MVFSSYGFILLFLPITLVLYLGLNQMRLYTGAKFFMIGASILFYSWWKIDHLFIMLVAIIFNYGISGYIGKKRDAGKPTKPLLVAGIAANLLLLGYFKYMDFFIRNVNELLQVDIHALGILLPLAMSFYTFTMIAHLVDTAQGKATDRSFANYSLFVLYYPHLIAGPIVHHKALMSQFADEALKRVNWNNIALGLFIFAIGVFKKAVIADGLSGYVDTGFKDPASLEFYSSWLLALCYTFQLYFDFSGYCDMAIGAAKMMNIDLPVNFRSPYKASSIQDFWRRWHITLSNFLRDYLYIPLGGSRKGLRRTMINVILVFFLGGLWHGAAWTFVLWGFLHGVALAIHGAWSKLSGITMPRLLGWFLTFVFVNVAWVIFRSHDLATAQMVIETMFGAKGFAMPPQITQLGLAQGYLESAHLLGYLLMAMVLSFCFANSMEMAERFRVNIKTLLITLVAFAAGFFMMDHNAPFLYWNF